VIASLRGLVVLAVIVIALAVALVVGDDSTTGSSETRTLGAPAQVDEFVLTRTGQEPVRVTKDARNGWNIVEGNRRAKADDAAVDALLAALRGAKWHRRVGARVAVAVKGWLQIGELRIGIGPALPGTDQSWIVLRDQALLVDGWVARALWPDPLALRIRRPLADVQGRRIEHVDVRLEGRWQTAPVQRWISETAYAALSRVLADLEYVALDGSPGADGPTITVDGEGVTEVGGCAGGRVLLSAAVGDGCVERAAWQAALAAFEPFRLAGSESIVDTRPAPFALTAVRFASGETLSVAGKPVVDTGGVVDFDRVKELVGALATQATIVPRPVAASSTTTLELRGAHGATVTLELYGSSVARKGESFALQPPADAMAMIRRPVAALRENVLWREDPITVTAVELDGVTYTRGAVVGEWTRKPAGSVDAAVVDAVVDTVATLKAPPGPAPARVAHRLTIRITPPMGEPRTHKLELAAPTATACSARVDGQPVQLDASDVPLCAAAAALAASR
jgi:hypothetical protein